jgi:uncharacterized Ntn-hydrolase superfamily protein
MSIPSTFSIVARDAETGDLAVAVQSKFLAVGAVVPFAVAGVGAIATQALCNTHYGPRGLDLLREGHEAEAVLARLLAPDPLRERRQVGIVDIHGTTAVHTGSGCMAWAGSARGSGVSCQGNILVSRDTVEAMAESMMQASMPFPERLVHALSAGQQAGGDARGQQSAALLVVREQGGYGRQSDRYIDLRVDDHPDPIVELQRLLGLHHLYFERPAEADIVTVDENLRGEIADLLGTCTGAHLDPADVPALSEALERWMGAENLEERILPSGQIDGLVLQMLRSRAANRDGVGQHGER